jgi:hypothetical protein
MKLICKTNSVYIDKYTYQWKCIGNLDYLTINKSIWVNRFYISGTMTESNDTYYLWWWFRKKLS